MKKSVYRLSSIIVLSLITFHSSLSTSFAAGPPDPKPCKNPIVDEKSLVDNYLLDKNGNPLPGLTFNLGEVSGDGENGQSVSVKPQTFSFTVDFSKLQSLFGDSNSNYFEGKAQSEQRRTTNLLGLNSQDLQKFNGPIQKAQPAILVDEQKKNYVKYVYDHNQLAESANKYTDIENKGTEKTIYDLVTEYGQPQPPKANASKEEKDAWMQTWGKYWAKIPTSYSEFYQGELAFHYIAGDYSLSIFKDPKNDKANPDRGATCPNRAIQDTIKFVLPEFARTTQTSDQLNRLIVPKAAQSYQFHPFLQTSQTQGSNDNKNLTNPIAGFFDYCWKILSNQTRNVIENFRKSSPVSLKIPNLMDIIAPPILAQSQAENPSCIKLLNEAKAGTAPYCPLPLTEIARLGSAVSCSNKQDSLNLEQDNHNVVCTFTLTTSHTTYYVTKDDPACTQKNGSEYTCQVKLYIVPNFRIPWLAAIWNNTLYSDRSDIDDPTQETGRPGLYSFFTPKAIGDGPITKAELYQLFTDCIQSTDLQSVSCSKLFKIFDQLAKDNPNADAGCVEVASNPNQLVRCFGTVIGQLDKNLPGTADKSSQETAKQRFIGATDCSKQFVRDIALKPKALQTALGIQTECDLNASTAGTSQSSGPAPGNDPPNENNCNGLYNLNGNPLHKNFGDPACDFTIEKLTQRLQNLDPSNVNTWLSMLSIESGFNPNAFAAVSTSGTAWGLFQMGHEAYPDLGISKQMNNDFDRGDVVWGLQAFNAVNYNHADNNKFCYWDAAFTLGIVNPANCP